MFHLIERYLWIIGLLFAFLNNYSLRSQAKQRTALHPELVENYRRYVLGDLIFYSAPWLVMGIGILIGGVPSVFDFLKPCSGNPFVIAFHLTVILLVVGVACWVWFWGGAQGLIKIVEVRSPFILKLKFAGAVLFIFFIEGTAFMVQR